MKIDVVKRALATAQVCALNQYGMNGPGGGVPATDVDVNQPVPSFVDSVVGPDDCDSEDEVSGVSSDAFDGLSVAGLGPPGQDDLDDVDVELKASILCWQESCMCDDVKDAPINQGIADVVNVGLRVRPKDDINKEKAAGNHTTANLPNLVLVNNSDTEQALCRGTVRWGDLEGFQTFFVPGWHAGCSIENFLGRTVPPLIGQMSCLISHCPIGQSRNTSIIGPIMDRG